MTDELKEAVKSTLRYARREIAFHLRGNEMLINANGAVYAIDEALRLLEEGSQHD